MTLIEIHTYSAGALVSVRAVEVPDPTAEEVAAMAEAARLASIPGRVDGVEAELDELAQAVLA